jgi:phosphoribosylformylglycinamidine cyclo-ligase
MESTFNMGVGMFAIVSAQDADRALAFLAARKVDAWQAGEVVEGAGVVRMVNSYTSG